MGHVDTRSPESAYASKPNILHPGTAVQRAEAEKQAAARAADYTSVTQDTVSVTNAVVTLTKHIKG